jgi:aminoglycoside phosphotransferase (APT) family kinase protein
LIAWVDLVQTVALEQWMTQQGLEQGPLRDFVPLSGGTQNVLLRFRRGNRSFVLRRPPPHPRPESNNTMRREARMLAALAETTVPHPRLIAACAEDDVLGVAFYLMEPVDGFNPATGLPALHSQPAAQRRMGMALVDAVLTLGAIDYRAVGLADLGKPENYLERQVARWKSQLDGYQQFAGWPGPSGLRDVERIAHWLDAHRPGRFDPGIIHGDYHLGNVMYRHDAPELAAVVDWELTTIGDPLLDLGWLLATWPGEDLPVSVSLNVQPWVGFPTRFELIERYRAGSSRDMSAIAWYATLACFKLGIILEGTYARACAGKADRETGDALHAATVGLLQRAVSFITSGAM